MTLLNGVEVIQPQVPLRLPCYDFSLLTQHNFKSTLRTNFQLYCTRMERRAVCARSRDVFTVR